MPGRHVQSSSWDTTALSLLNNWLATAHVFSPFLSISSVPPAPFLSSLCSLFSTTFLLFLLCLPSYFIFASPFPSRSITERLWIVKLASTYRHSCNPGDKEGSILKSVQCETSLRGEASFSVFTSSGQFLTPQLLFGNSCREWRKRETGRTCWRRVKCCMSLFFSVSILSIYWEKISVRSLEQAPLMLHGYRPRMEWRLAREWRELHHTLMRKEIHFLHQQPWCLLLNMGSPPLAQLIILGNQSSHPTPILLRHSSICGAASGYGH